jgi:hypothetical protein
MIVRGRARVRSLIRSLRLFSELPSSNFVHFECRSIADGRTVFSGVRCAVQDAVFPVDPDTLITAETAGVVGNLVAEFL